ncbi:MAG: hypothetical protein M3Z27_06085 [Actinomycetota bacterium]|nr:hypothetical protein [Actinomycetota bacterium]
MTGRPALPQLVFPSDYAAHVLTVSPPRARAGRGITFRFSAVAVLGTYRSPVAGAIVRFAGRRVRTSGRGRATLRRPSRYAVAVAGCLAGRAVVKSFGRR